MLRTHWKTAAFTVAGLGLMTPVQGDQITDMQTQIDALRTELSQVQSDQGDNWLNERRAEEVKGLIMEVLSDADMRASLAGDGSTSGYGEDGFYIMSADGAFSLYLSGQVDFRYIWNNQDDKATAPNGDEDEGGFQTRRLKLMFDGHISSPKVGYHIQLARDMNSSAGDIILEEYHVSHQINDNVQIAGGLIKLPFLREELISSARQLAVERSTTNEFFTLGRAEGVRLAYADGPLLINFMVSDGADSGLSEFDDDTAEIALTIRLDYLVEGERSQLDDFTGSSGEGQALNIGAAYHIEYGDSRNSTGPSPLDAGNFDLELYTVDVQWENGPVNLFGSYVFANVDPDDSSVSDVDADGFVVQGGIHVVPDKVEFFGRWEFIDVDASGVDEFTAWTFGMNYYVNGHKTKFTVDVLILEDDVPMGPNVTAGGGTGLGLITGHKDEVVVRTQLQLLF